MSNQLLLRRVASVSCWKRFGVRHTTSSTSSHRCLSTTIDPGNDGNDDDRSVSIGNVRVDSAPAGSDRPDLIPSLHPYESTYIAPCQLSHLRWMLQKDLRLHQDFLLMGHPALARDRRHLVFLYAALVGREVEYVAISRDTSDADLKQRKEVDGRASIYVHQAPVRAALEGRLLILDSIEKAERNVLPTLNNLLENRELSLDDGGLLVAPHIYDQQEQSSPNSSTTSTIHRVHPDFRVAALASVPANLDPPLRSRFQARVAHPMDPGEMLHVLAAVPHRTLDSNQLQQLVGLASTVPDGISLQSVGDAANYLEHYTSKVLSPRVALLPHGLGMLSVDDVEEETPVAKQQPNNDNHNPSFVPTATTQTVQSLIQNAFASGNRAVALVGPKGCYKSALARQLASQDNKKMELFSLYSDMTARDCLLTRGTDGDGNTVWRPTPLTRAVQQGHAVILDGIDKVGADTLTSALALLLEQGQVDLPNGQRLQAPPGFCCIALAHSDNNWMTPEIQGMFHWIRVDPLPSPELKEVLTGLYPSLDVATLDKIVNLRDRLDAAITSGAADTAEEQESLVLSLRKIKHICKRVERQEQQEDLPRLVHNALLTSLMPERERKIVMKCMKDCGIVATKKTQQNRQQQSSSSTLLDETLLESCRRTPKHPLLVPNPVFEENPGHAHVLNDILDAHAVGERALLIMGFQGVGKNRVVDYLLNKLQCEREYLQLHRDTTVQSLLSSPSVEDGRIVYGDSPLVRAAKHGRILVVDEADKAPVEVVALLKGLIEDGELALPDGRVLRYNETGAADSAVDDDDTIFIHPDFRVWALANPSGYPFHGNDLAREMADVFSCHTVPALDAESQRRILKRYGPNVSDNVINTIIDIWQDLRESHEKGVMAYPFSVREAVSVIKHLNQFPSDGLDGALENVIAFDRFDNVTLKQLASVFNRHGVPVSIEVSGRALEAGTEGGISTPRTRTSSPKHGKIDEKNDPHVGGNTWAGGSGGSDTAGLGGRGGPYRLDSGHPVHQVSDEMKAEVSEEAQRKAREMARDALEQKLKELNMGELDWERYNHLHQQVAVQIQQLQVLLKDIKRRKQERMWLKRQSTGELDDSRLVDALAGEKDVFKRRGQANENNNPNSAQDTEPIAIKLVVDVSASMYRFNGFDGRLQRLLEATLMIMEALKDDERFELNIVGHNGDSAEIPLVTGETSQDPKTQLRVLESMVAHTQYTFAGDSTLEAIELAVSQAHEGDLVLVISDANLKRYRIDPTEVSALLRRKDVHAHLVLIGGFGEEPIKLARAIPNERAQVCLDSAELPLILKNIVASAAK
ncbi:Willebrand factor A domain-containing protein 8 [Seminavis robusta]|uniref:Willebrand factor A domain-containing protein 8 n=1 Tax=Seminavis robusta TaxID=568900 RepID=A0A9N8H951_9STRA|nr:Willebrand factor A domain-containing protein 8 [Seminavis robusta]|eukprot:Sro107_g054040.1 Willebrand factor A domain-containing protein 8 (1317) ;mRNA; r:106279-110229